MADSSAAVDKPLLAFLNGISKRHYFGEDDITDEFLREDILGGIAEEGLFLISLSVSLSLSLSQADSVTLITEYAALLKRYSAILNSLVSANMDFNQLDAFLQSQMKKRQVNK